MTSGDACLFVISTHFHVHYAGLCILHFKGSGETPKALLAQKISDVYNFTCSGEDCSLFGLMKLSKQCFSPVSEYVGIYVPNSSQTYLILGDISLCLLSFIEGNPKQKLPLATTRYQCKHYFQQLPNAGMQDINQSVS